MNNFTFHWQTATMSSSTAATPTNAKQPRLMPVNTLNVRTPSSPRVATVLPASPNVPRSDRVVQIVHRVDGQSSQLVATSTPSSTSLTSMSSIHRGMMGTATPAVRQTNWTYNSNVTRGFASAPGAMATQRNPSVDLYPYGGMRRYPRSTDKSKGLRHFSTKVCEKVKEKGHTSYNEVADELVQDYFDSLALPPGDQEKQQYDMKNIRRRVYDALNVLMAMNIIEKEKKEIRWVGLPTSSVQECERLEKEKAKRTERIQQKTEQLYDLIIQLVTYKALVERNRELERTNGRPSANTLLHLPYIIVATDKQTVIDCSISHDKTEYLFNFDRSFSIHDDIEVLKRLGLAFGLEDGKVAEENVAKVKSFLPPALRVYVDKINDGTLTGLSMQEDSSMDRQQSSEYTDAAEPPEAILEDSNDSAPQLVRTAGVGGFTYVDNMGNEYEEVPLGTATASNGATYILQSQ